MGSTDHSEFIGFPIQLCVETSAEKVLTDSKDEEDMTGDQFEPVEEHFESIGFPVEQYDEEPEKRIDCGEE
eukprot:15460609-Alexandrium_andersonii.AAC.1